MVVRVLRMFPMVCAALCGGCLVLQGQVRQWDYTQRVEEFENKRFETEVTRPSESNRWMSRRFDTRRYATDTHRFADDRFDAGKIELYRSNEFRTRELDFEEREVEWFRGKDKGFRKEDLEKIRFNTLHHFAKKESMVADEDPAIDVDALLDQLSLADLNRYQFRRSHSPEPGIPVQRAASEEVPEPEE